VKFVPLRVRSHGSLLDGTASPRTLIERALTLGYDALALADRDNLYLALAFYRFARAAGLTPLLGAEVTSRDAAGDVARTAETTSRRRRTGALLVTLDRRGYANLCAVLTARQLDADFDLVRGIAAWHAGLHVVVESPGLAAALLAAGVPAATGVHPGPARHRAGAGGLWLGVRGIAAEHGPAGGGRLRERIATARRLRVPLVATGDVVMLEPRDWDAHRIAVTAAAGELLERMPSTAFAAREAWLAGPAEWAGRVRATCAAAGVPEAADEALANNAALAARCHLELELGVPIFPKAPLPGTESGPAWLRRQAEAGLARRYGRGGAGVRAARARLAGELAIIERLGFTGYFLVVAEIVAFARAQGIPTVGRGSGASSIVSYVLGITNVDPLRHGLCFERFLHPQRRDCPDLDIDLCWQRRDEVIAHVFETCGRDRVAMISTHATLGARSAFRETAKALGVANARVNALAKRIPRALEAPYLDRLLALPDARGVDWREPPLARALALAERLDGAPRHLSVHCGGIVIADRPLTWYVPLERAGGTRRSGTDGSDVVVTQFEMRAIEQIGLVKLDLLGNRALSTLGECVTLARRGETRAGGPDDGANDGAPPSAVLDPDRVPEDDPATAARVAAGDTLNCFQLESPAMRHLLRMLRAHTLEETIAAVALVRPGPAESGMKEAFCRRHRGLEPPTFHHPDLVPVLDATHGVMLYEEDVMRVAAALAGLSLAEGDDLRRALAAARDDEEFRSLERGFVAACAHRGVEVDVARAVWRDLTRFAAYAFCKAHAAGYGALGWQSAYFKTHFPTEWAVGILNHHAGMYATWVHVEDLRRRGVEFRPPCVNRSAWATSLETSPEPNPGVEGSHANRTPPGAGPESFREAARRRTQPGGYPREAWVRSAPRKSEPEQDCEGERARGGSPVLHPAAPRSSDVHDRPLTLAPSTPAGPSSALSTSHSAPAVRVGLGRVFGLAEATGERIMAERAGRPFRTFADFVDRVRPTLPELESFVLAGAFDFTGRTRPSLLLEARLGSPPMRQRSTHVARGSAGARAPTLVTPDGADLAPEPVSPVTAPDLPEFDLAERVRGECRATGLWFSAHPLDVFVEARSLAGTVAAAVPAHAGRRVAIAGLPCAWRRVETRSGGILLFLTLADRSGLAECVLFPDTFRRYAQEVRAQVVRVEGRVDETLDAVTLVVERAAALA
jgi:DNA polymerase III subunit alpha